LINIHDNLHGQIKKGPLQKVLDQLTSDGQLQMKEYGKAKVYLLNQNNIPEVDKSELETLNTELNRRREKLTQLNEKTKEMNAKLKEILSELTNDQLDQELKSYEALVSGFIIVIIVFCFLAERS
jgi:septal ring factor EnvC (AmiA/AmiB activator)